MRAYTQCYSSSSARNRADQVVTNRLQTSLLEALVDRALKLDRENSAGSDER